MKLLFIPQALNVSRIKIARDQLISRIAVAVSLGIFATYVFKLAVYDKFLGVKKFPDYGPTLFSCYSFFVFLIKDL